MRIRGLVLFVVALFLSAGLTGCARQEPSSTGGSGKVVAGRSDASHSPTGASRSDSVVTAALARAEKAGKNVLVEWTSEECSYCDEMEESTLSDAKVKESLERDVVHVRIVKEEDDQPFTSRWSDAGTPSFVVLRPDGKQLGSMVSGVVAKPDFLAFLNWARTGEGNQPGFTTGGT